MSEKDDAAEWVIESYVGNVGWSLSRLNDDAEAHTLDWCMDQWNRFKRGDFWDAPFEPSGLLTEPYRYRLRNVRTEDTIMCAIL
jgi:hypothetical protein